MLMRLLWSFSSILKSSIVGETWCTNLSEVLLNLLKFRFLCHQIIRYQRRFRPMTLDDDLQVKFHLWNLDKFDILWSKAVMQGPKSFSGNMFQEFSILSSTELLTGCLKSCFCDCLKPSHVQPTAPKEFYHTWHAVALAICGELSWWCRLPNYFYFYWAIELDNKKYWSVWNCAMLLCHFSPSII
jgi:hypothetical protein